MGRTAREIVKANLDEVIKDLLQAYSDEWLAHYQYWLAAQWIRGIDADTLRPVLLRQSMDELKHAEKLAQRIIQLGGRPVMDFSKLLNTSKCGYIAPPEDPTDLRKVVEDVLKAEQCAIRFYSQMVEKYRATDVVTYEIFEDLLEDEVDDEEEWERFLAKL
ncbi:MAG: ferritin-like domain-containing protein [Thaumarchaeota archaeon]|nr:ferritin-like domain-containing protein [Candidatus Calditenuaceae archaeon]MDW8041887.1 ferritin-like domain-containing protein [Nitrososphaerota archaeon]